MPYDLNQTMAPKGVPIGRQWIKAGQSARAVAGWPTVSQKAEGACAAFAAKYRNLRAYERCESIDSATGEVFFGKKFPKHVGMDRVIFYVKIKEKRIPCTREDGP